MEGFSWTISGATILVVLGWASTIGAMIWSRSGDEANQKAKIANAHKRLDEVEKRVSGLDTEIDMRVSALQGSSTLLREQQHELRQELAKNYMTRSEIAKIEERVHEGQNRIVDRMDAIDARIGQMQDRILDAIQKARGA